MGSKWPRCLSPVVTSHCLGMIYGSINTIIIAWRLRDVLEIKSCVLNHRKRSFFPFTTLKG